MLIFLAMQAKILLQLRKIMGFDKNRNSIREWRI